MPQASPFDQLAAGYDQAFTHTQIGRMQRDRVWRLLMPVTQGDRPLRILELNCGTGEDAIHFATMGHDVTATDGSEAMIGVANQKAALVVPGEIKGRLRFVPCRFDEVSTLAGEGRFDLVLSNFGGINCIAPAAVQSLGVELGGLLRDGGRLVVVVMSRFCIWETAYFLYKLKFAKAFRRFHRHQTLNLGGRPLEFYPYSPSAIRRLMQPAFTAEQCNPVGLTVPPSYLDPLFSPRSGWLKRLGRLEAGMARHKSLAPFADHFCMMLKKQGS